MLRPLLLAALLLATAASAASAPAEAPVVGYATVGGWGVYVDLELDRSCYLVGSFRSGMVVSFGADRRPGDGAGYLVLANPAWKDLVDGGSYPVTIRYDAHRPWAGRARAAILDGVPSLTFRFVDTRFARQFAEGRALVVRREGRRIAALDLGSSSGAVRTMMACQAEVDGLTKAMGQDDEEGPDVAAERA